MSHHIQDINFKKINSRLFYNAVFFIFFYFTAIFSIKIFSFFILKIAKKSLLGLNKSESANKLILIIYNFFLKFANEQTISIFQFINSTVIFSEGLIFLIFKSCLSLIRGGNFMKNFFANPSSTI